MLNVMLSHREEDDRIERFCNLETLGITEPDPHIDENSFICEYQQTSISREQDGSYTARFPWKKDRPPLPTNNIVCQKRTRATIKRLNQTSDWLHTYGTIIKEQGQRDFIEKIPNTANNHNVHYVPHHPVRKDSLTTPIGIIYNCSCKASPKFASVNDCLQPGPLLLNDTVCQQSSFDFVPTIVSLLIKRKHSFTLTYMRRIETSLDSYGYRIRQIQTVPLTPIVLRLFRLGPQALHSC